MNFLFACTPNLFKYLSVTLLSLLDRCFIQEKGQKINIHILYANIGNDTLNNGQGTNQKNKLINIIKRYEETEIFFYDISDKIEMFRGQNVGLWGSDISLTHYLYLLAPIILNDIDTVLYLDTDLIISRSPVCLFNEPQEKQVAIGMASPSGNEIVSDQSNSGVVFLNLKYWREHNILDDILELGRNLKKCQMCDQNLLYWYFTKSHPDLIYYFDRRWNLFPHKRKDNEEIYIFHHAGVPSKPWNDPYSKILDRDLWWYYARQSPYYEEILFSNVNNKLNTVSNKLKCLDDSLSEIKNFSCSLDKNYKNSDEIIRIINNKWKILLLYKFYRILKELKLPYNSAQFAKYKKYRNLILEYSLK